MSFSIFSSTVAPVNIPSFQETPHTGAAPIMAADADLWPMRTETANEVRKAAYRAVDLQEWVVIRYKQGAGLTSVLQWLVPKLERVKRCSVDYFDSFSLGQQRNSLVCADDQPRPHAACPSPQEHQGEHGRSRVVILDLDQWEPRDPQQCDQLLSQYQLVLEQLGENCIVIVAGQAELIAALGESEEIGPRMETALSVTVDYPTEEELLDLLEAQSREFVFDLPDDLTEQLVTDFGELVADADWRPEAFRLVQAMLRELYRRGELDMAGYSTLGGLKGLPAHLADEALRDAPSMVRDAAQRCLFRLSELGEGTADRLKTRPLSEFTDVDGKLIDERSLRRLEAVGLLRIEEDSRQRVTCLHKSLLRTWAPLQRWIDSNRNMLRALKRLRESSRAWVRAEYATTTLLNEAELPYLSSLLEDKDHLLTTCERQFLHACESNRVAKEESERRILTEQFDEKLRELESRHLGEIAALNEQIAEYEIEVQKCEEDLRVARRDYRSGLVARARERNHWRVGLSATVVLAVVAIVCCVIAL